MDLLNKRKDNFIKKSIEIHGGIYDYSKVVYVNINTKVCIIDPEYGEFWQTPKCHQNGQGNKKRRFKELSNRMKNTTASFISKANNIHHNLYDYSKVKYIDCFTPVCVIDPEYGEFWIRPIDHLQGYGNKERSLKNRKTKRSLGTEEFIKRSKDIFGENYFDYSKVNYLNNTTDVTLIHPSYGEFDINPKAHLYGKRGHPLDDKKQKNYRTGPIDKTKLEKDHIIPLSIICSGNINSSTIERNRPLYKFLNSDINIQIIERKENSSKNDIILFNNRNIRARSIRNDYDKIYIIVKDILDIDISIIIEEDKKYLLEINNHDI